MIKKTRMRVLKATIMLRVSFAIPLSAGNGVKCRIHKYTNTQIHKYTNTHCPLDVAFVPFEVLLTGCCS